VWGGPRTDGCEVTMDADTRAQVATALRAAAEVLAFTTPLPKFEKGEPGLMTLDEFLTSKNPGDKWHPSETYNYDVHWSKDRPGLNRALDVVAYNDNHKGRKYALLVPYGGGEGHAITREGTLIAVLSNGVMYTNERNPNLIPRSYFSGPTDIQLEEPKKVKRVKYPSEYVRLISNIAARNRKKYNHLLQNVVLDGESFQVLSEGSPVKNKQQTIAVLNDRGEEVAFAADEWGATLLTVAREYRRKGIGDLLLRLWNKFNPDWQSGGTTDAGRMANTRLWEGRVLEFLSLGWYSELVRQKKMSTARVKEITSRLSPDARRKVHAPAERKVTQKGTTLLYLDDPKDPVSFVLYDSRFLDDPQADSAEKYIFGYGFFRDSEHAKAPFLYRIDYDREWDRKTTSVAMQIAKNAGHKVWVGDTYGDMLELDLIPEVKVENNLAWLERDLLPIDKMAGLERKTRKSVDPYGEIESILLETAEAKWL